MHTSHLRKHVLTYNRLIGGYRNTTKAFDHSREVVQLTLHDVRLGMKLVLQYSLHGGHRRIATTLPQPIYGDVQATSTTIYSSQRVRHGKVVVVMGMKIEMRLRIALYHLAEILDDLQRIHHSQRVRQHKTGYLLLAVSS